METGTELGVIPQGVSLRPSASGMLERDPAVQPGARYIKYTVGVGRDERLGFNLHERDPLAVWEAGGGYGEVDGLEGEDGGRRPGQNGRDRGAGRRRRRRQRQERGWSRGRRQRRGGGGGETGLTRGNPMR